jgi:hypothetical protein
VAIAAAGLIANAWEVQTLLPRFSDETPTFGPFSSFGDGVFILWILAFVASIAGWRRTSAWLLACTIPASILAQVAGRAVPTLWMPTTTTLGFLALLAVLAIACGVPSSRRGRIRLSASAVGWGAAIALSIWFIRATDGAQYGSVDWFIGSLLPWLAIALPCAVLIAAVLWRARRSAWAPAMLLMACPVAILEVFGWQHPDQLIARTLIAAGVALSAGLLIGLLRLGGLRIRITRV